MNLEIISARIIDLDSKIADLKLDHQSKITKKKILDLQMLLDINKDLLLKLTSNENLGYDN